MLWSLQYEYKNKIKVHTQEMRERERENHIEGWLHETKIINNSKMRVEVAKNKLIEKFIGTIIY